MKRPMIAACSVVALGLAAGLAVSAAPALGQDAEQPDGAALFEQHKCGMCHGVPAAGIEATTKSEAMKGPDLEGAVEVDLEALAAYLRQEGEIEGLSKHKKGYKGTDEELQAILDWLGSLEASE